MVSDSRFHSENSVPKFAQDDGVVLESSKLQDQTKRLNKKLLRDSYVSIYNHNVRGLQKDEYVEEMVSWFKQRKGLAACLQETWKTGDTIEENDGILIINHGPKEKKSKRGSLGVSIVLNQAGRTAWEKAGSEMLHYGPRILATRLKFEDKQKKANDNFPRKRLCTGQQ